MSQFDTLYATINALREEVQRAEHAAVIIERDLRTVLAYFEAQDADGEPIPVNIQNIINKYTDGKSGN